MTYILICILALDTYSYQTTDENKALAKYEHYTAQGYKCMLRKELR